LKSTKRRISGLLAVTLGFAMIAGACGDDSDSTTDTTPATTAAAGAGANTAAPTTTAKKVEVTGTLSASGATFPKGYYEVVIAEFKKAQPKASLTYAGGGSGKGRTDLQEQVVDWAGTDGLVKAEDKPKYNGPHHRLVQPRWRRQAEPVHGHDRQDLPA
jgi:phosphate transport system substrate-binding protein